MFENPPPTEFPADRTPSFEIPTTCPTLDRAWTHSRRSVESLRARLAESDLDDVATIALFGSVGRMESLPHSDLDVSIVVDRGSIDADQAWANDLNRRFWSIVEPLGFEAPKPDGIFGEPASREALTNRTSRGRLDEPPAVFGKRLQLLLDAQPLVNTEAFALLQDDVLAYFGIGTRQPPPFADWSFLLGELSRYRRALAVRYQWLRRDDPGTWRMLALKSRFSRTLNLSGLLILLGAATTIDRGGRRGWLGDRLRWTPLERLAAQGTPRELLPILTGYERFLTAFADPAFREAVADPNVPIGDPLAEFDELVTESERFNAAIARLIQYAGQHWDPKLTTQLLV